MTETLTPIEPVEVAVAAPAEVEPHEAPPEEVLVAGRPVEDRSFEAVEVGAGAMAGLIVGTAVAGPIGAAAGGLIGGAVALVASEALERHEGRAAETTDAVDDEPVPVAHV